MRLTAAARSPLAGLMVIRPMCLAASSPRIGVKFSLTSVNSIERISYRAGGCTLHGMSFVGDFGAVPHCGPFCGLCEQLGIKILSR